MGLEQDIRQNTFRNDFQKATVNLLFTHHWLERKLAEFFKQFDLSLQQYNVMRIVMGQHPKPISTAGLRKRLIDPMSDVSRIVDRLHKKGLLTRAICQSDKRLVDITLSSQGREVMDQLESVVEHLDGLLHRLSDTEAQQLNYLLDKIRG